MSDIYQKPFPSALARRFQEAAKRFLEWPDAEEPPEPPACLATETLETVARPENDSGEPVKTQG